MKIFLSCLLFFLISTDHLFAVSYSWTGNGGTGEWANTANWNPAGIPGTGDDVTINAGTLVPVLDQSRGINSFTIANNKSLDLNGNTLSISGAASFTSGSVISSVAGAAIAVNSLSNCIFGSSTTGITIGSTSVNVGVTVSSPDIYISHSTFNGTVDITRTSSITTMLLGGNIYNGVTTFHLNSGSWYHAQVNPDVFNDQLTLINTSSGTLCVGYASTNNKFWGNIKIDQTNSGRIIVGNSTKTTTLGPNVTVSLLGTSITGDLYLTGLKFPNGISQLLDLGCTANLYLQWDEFNAQSNFRAGHIYTALNTSSVSAPVTMEKCGGTSGSSDVIYGGNVYGGTVTIINSSLAHMCLANNAPDTYNNDVTFTSSNNSYIFPNYVANGTAFNGNIILNKTTGGGGFNFGSGANAYSTLADGKTIFFNTAAGNTVWYLYLYKFNQKGSTSQNLNLSNPLGQPLNSYGQLFVTQCSFEGPVNFKSNTMSMQQSTFWGTSIFERTGNSDPAIWANGGNEYKTDVEFINDGTSTWLNGNSYPDKFNTVSGDVTCTIKSSGYIVLGNSTPNNQFNGNIKINNTGTGFLQICPGSNATGTLASNKTFLIGPAGFSSGGLDVRHLVQNGTESINLNAIPASGSNTSISFGDANLIYGEMNLTASSVTFYGTGGIYNGVVTANIKGSTQWSGKVTFNNDIIVNQNTAGTYLYIGANGSDLFQFYGNASFNKNAVNNLMVAMIGTCEFYKNLAYNYSGGLGYWPYHFGYNAGICKFLGSNPQTISSNNPAGLEFYSITVDKPANHVTIATNIYIEPMPNHTVTAPILTLKSGNIICSGSSFISLSNIDANGNIINVNANGPITSTNDVLVGGSAKSFVDGPLIRRGTYAFTFPVGKGNIYMPLSISAPGNASYQIEAILGDPSTLGLADASVGRISNCQFWKVTKLYSSGSSINVTLPWNSQTCNVINPVSVRVARFNGVLWTNAGANNLISNGTSGSITSDALSSFGYFTFGTNSVADAYVRLNKELDGGYALVGDNQILKIRFDEEYNVVSGKEQLQYNIYDVKNKVVQGYPDPNNQIQYGYNKLGIKVSSLSAGNFYLLEVKNQKGEKWYLRFKIQ